MSLFKHAEMAVTLRPKDNGTQATYESQFETVAKWKFAEGVVARIGKKRIEGNMNAAKRVLNSRGSAVYSSISRRKASGLCLLPNLERQELLISTRRN